MQKNFRPQLSYFLIVALLLSNVVSLFTFVPKVEAAGTNIDLATTGNWNIRIDGAAGNDQLSLLGTAIDDLDGDGKKDLVLGALDADNNSRSASGSVYIIYSSTLSSLTGTANTIDLATSTSYNVRFDGATAGDNLGAFNPQIADLDLDGKKDLLLSARTADVSSRADAGAVYVIYGSQLDDWTGTGNNVDLATTTNWNIRFDGAAASDVFGRSTFEVGDLSNNGRPDIMVGARGTDYNSRADSGSLYVIYDSIFSGLSGTGNILDMNDSSKWNLRFDGAAGGVNHLFTLGGGGAIVDVTSDGRNDMIVGSANESNNSRSFSGSTYIFSNGLMGSFTGTGNAIDTASSSAWTLRIDGATTGDGLAVEKSLAVGDVDTDGRIDLVIGSQGSDYNSRSSSGSWYVLKNGIFSSLLSSTGNTLDLSSASSYSIRFDGAAASDSCGRGQPPVNDFDSDGRNDLVIGCFVADNNSRSNSGSVFLISSTLLSGWNTSGTNVDLADTANYTVRYDGAVASDNLSYANNYVEDINGDGASDMLLGAYLADNNSRSNSGSFYIIYNFPHTLAVNESRIDTSNTNPHITGSLTASNSTTTLSDIQYSLSDASPTATSWTSCTASDGSFNSTSESFNCALSFSADATHNVFIRAKDTNGSYTPARRYGSLPLTVDRVSPPLFSINAPQYSQDGTVAVNGSYNDDRSGLDKIQVKGIGNTPVVAGLNGASWSVTYANVPDGVYQLSAISYDRAGNEKQVVAGNTTIVDRAAPAITATPAYLTDTSQTVEQGVTIEGRVSDGYAGVKSLVLLNETTNSTIPTRVNTDGSYKTDVTLRKGTNTIKLTASDFAGNIGTKTITVTRTSFISAAGKDIPITDEKGITKKYKQVDIAAGLKPGKTNIFVRSLQDSLKQLGHYTSNVTGFFGDLTKKAVIAFQKSTGIKQSGTVQAQTLARFDGAVTNPNYLSAIAQTKAGLSQRELTEAVTYQLTKDIQAGKYDEEVKFIQKKLYVLGYYSGAISGWLNSTTLTAINEYRVDRGIGKGGVDSKLREKLNSF